MSRTKNTKNQLKSKLELIKKINDDPKRISNDLYDLYLNDNITSADKFLGKKIDEFLDKRNKKKDNKKDIFSDLVDIADSFVGFNYSEPTTDRIFSKNKIKKYTLDSISRTLNVSKQIVLDNTKKIFFAGDGICGAQSTINFDSISLSPKEFDILNVLTIDPDSTSGQIIYEPLSPDNGKQKVNRGLYDSFSGVDYEMKTLSNNTLFTAHWDVGTQKFQISGLTQNNNVINVGDFFNDYYSSIEFPDIATITKNAMYLTLQTAEGDNQLIQKAINELNRLIAKLFKICGKPKDGQELKQTPNDQFGETDEDIEFYFDFNNVEGIDIDDENNRLRKVLKFTDCNNFEVQTNDSIIEDFVYFFNKKTLDEVINTTISTASTDAYDQSDSSIPQINFNLSLLNSFILNLPKALIQSIFTPKIFLPIVTIYKIFKSNINTFLDVKELMRKLYKLFSSIIKDLFWLFIREFWKLIRVDLQNFIAALAEKILRNKYKRYLTIVTSLISLLKRLMVEKIDNCYDLFNLILNTVNNTLRGGRATAIPGLLLSFSNNLPGYSQDRALMNILERLESAGISTSPIYGETNKLPSLIKSVIDGHMEEQDTNGFIAGSNQFLTVPSAGGPIVFPPGVINIFGKLR